MTEHTPLERAARALMQQADIDPDVYIGLLGGYGHWLDAARDVIKAIRVPSEVMSDAALANEGCGCLCCVNADNWQAMIDAALDE